MEEVKHKVLVLSGKGGVGKSTVSSYLAIFLHSLGLRVGILDIDFCGPSQPYLFDLKDRNVYKSNKGYIPVYVDDDHRLGIMSLGFLMQNPDESVVWRGPKKTAVIKQFVHEIYWGPLDYLIIDTPPGVSDEVISLLENLMKYRPDGAVLVTTPQNVSLGDVRREITFCKRASLPILGLVENMSGYTCPGCNEVTNIFSKGGGAQLAVETKVPYMGALPIDPRVKVWNALDFKENSLLALYQFAHHLHAAQQG